MGKGNDNNKIKHMNGKGRTEQMRKTRENREMEERKRMEQMDPEERQRQMEQDLAKIRSSGMLCDCFGCRGYADGEIRVKHPWFFGKYRERKARERYEESMRSREKTLVELKKILADYEERLGLEKR